MTLLQLMHHTSGLSEYFPALTPGGDPTLAVDRAEVLRRIGAERRLDFAPGSRWAYSNSSYVLLAEVIERVSGQTCSAFLRSQVFEPLGLPMEATDGAVTSGLPRPYARTASGFGPGGWNFCAMGAIGVRATAYDLPRWSDDYRTGAVGGTALLEDQSDDAPVTTLERSRYGPAC